MGRKPKRRGGDAGRSAVRKTGLEREKTVQIISTGFGIGGSAIAGAAVDWVIGAKLGGELGSFAGPVGIVAGVTVGVGVSIAWEYLVEPGISWVFTSLGRPDPFLEIRHLQPLGGS